jgi:hypothetical protein
MSIRADVVSDCSESDEDCEVMRLDGAPSAATWRCCARSSDEDSALLELIPFEFDEPNELLLEIEGEIYAKVRGNGARVALDTTYPEAFGRLGLFCADMYARGIIGIQHATNRFSPIVQWFPRNRIC